MAIVEYDVDDLLDKESHGNVLVNSDPNPMANVAKKASDVAVSYMDALTAPIRTLLGAGVTLPAAGVAGVGGLFQGVEQPMLPQTEAEKMLGLPPRADHSKPVELNWEQARQNVENVSRSVGQFFQPQTAAGEFTNQLVTKPFEWLQKGAKKTGDYVYEKTDSPAAAALAATAVEASPMLIGPAVKGVKGGIKAIKNSTPIRMRTISERGLAVPSWDEVVKANPGLSQGELLRKYPAYKNEALRARSQGETASPKAAPTATPQPEAAPISVTPKQRAAVAQRVAELGSVDAVRKAYPNVGNAVDAYAVQLAEAAEAQGLFGQVAEPAVTPEVPTPPAVTEPLGLPEPVAKPQPDAVNVLPSGAPIELGEVAPVTPESPTPLTGKDLLEEKYADLAEALIEAKQGTLTSSAEPPKAKKPRTPNQKAAAELESLGAELMTRNGEEFWKHTLSNGEVVRLPKEGNSPAIKAIEEIQRMEGQIESLKSMPSYATVEEAKAAEYQLNPRSFNDLTSAENFAKSAGLRDDLPYEVIKVKDKYRPAYREATELENDISLDDLEDIDTAALSKSLEDYTESEATYGENFDIGEQLKAAIEQAAESESIATEVKNKMTAADRRARIKAAAEKAKAERQASRDKEIQNILDEDLDAYDGDYVSLDELRESDPDGGDYYDAVEEIEGRLEKAGRKFKDLVDLLGDERGAVGKDISKLKKSLKEVQEDLKAAQRKTKRIGLDAEAETIGEAAAAMGDFTNDKGQMLIEDLATVKEAVKESAAKTRANKKAAEVQDKAAKSKPLTDEEEQYIKAAIQRQQDIQAERWLESFSKDGSAVKDLVQHMKDTDRIVPEYKRGTFKMPRRQLPSIRPEMPKLLDPTKDMKGVTVKGHTTTSGHILTPSFALRPFFAPGTNPVIDFMESTMALSKNIRNMQRWRKDVFGDLKSAKKDIDATLQPVYDEVHKMLQEKDQLDAKINRHNQRYKDAKRLRDLNAKRLKSVKSGDPKTKIYKEEWARHDMEMQKWKEKHKGVAERRRALSKAISEKLFKGYDERIAGLAQRNPVVRVTLAAGNALPKGVTLTETEMVFADMLSEFFASAAQRMRQLGQPTIESSAYMSHMFEGFMTDQWARKFNYEPNVPTKMRFKRQSRKSRIWYPDLHIILDHYIPVVERKLAFQPFLDRWSDFIEHEAPPNMRAMMQDWLKTSLYRKEGGIVNAAINGAVSFEYMRLIALSLSIPLKHATKMADTLAINRPDDALYGLFQTNKAALQSMAKKLGMKGETPELDLFQTFVDMNQMVKLLDEGPGLRTSMRMVKAMAGSGTTFTEMFDNGVTIFANALASRRAGLTFEQARELIWDACLKANFRGGADQPYYLKNPVGRATFMFQTTRQKVTEFRMKLIKDFFEGGKDAYGRSKRWPLVQYVALIGAITSYAAYKNRDILPWFAEPPWVQEFVHSDREAPYVTIKELKPVVSPVIQLLTDWGKYGSEGVLNHFRYTPIKKYIDFVNDDYNSKYYNSPTDSLFGVRKVGAGHSSKPAKRPKRSGAAKRPKRR